jgi:hypothetical protein
MVHAFLGFVRRKGQSPPNKRKSQKKSEPKAQIMLCGPFMMSHDNMNPLIKHDIGLHL